MISRRAQSTSAPYWTLDYEWVCQLRKVFAHCQPPQNLRGDWETVITSAESSSPLETHRYAICGQQRDLRLNFNHCVGVQSEPVSLPDGGKNDGCLH